MRSGNRQPLGISILGGLLTADPVFPVGEVRTLSSRILWFHLYLMIQIGVRSGKTSQCGSASRASVVPQGYYYTILQELHSAYSNQLTTSLFSETSYGSDLRLLAPP